ncbi:hypothetical protein C9E91_00555 [Rhizobium sp. SEMIA4064]|nr:hypothetical protein C9E91_00555 [Rhizobium sp. SEMIA4064]
MKRRRTGESGSSLLLKRKERDMRISCPAFRPVSVADYWRFRLGQWEHVCSHCRRWPRCRATTV